MELYNGWDAGVISSSQEIIKLAQKFRNKFPKKLVTVKWRRGDRLHQDNKINGIDYTKEIYRKIISPNILVRTLNRLSAYKDIYILTNTAADDDVIHRLRSNKRYNFHFGFDIPELMKLMDKDNYFLFKVECEIEIVNCPDCWVIEFEDLAQTYYDKS